MVSRVDNTLRYAAFGWMMLVGLFGGAFVAGETFDDPGGWAAVLMVASWLLPLLGLAALALLRATIAEGVFVAATVVVALFTLADSAFGIIPRDDWGPVAAITVFALAIALGFLGLRRPALAGILLLGVGVAQAGAVLLVRVGIGGDRVFGGGSSSIVIVPVLIGGALYVLAGRRDMGTIGRRPPSRLNRA